MRTQKYHLCVDFFFFLSTTTQWWRPRRRRIQKDDRVQLQPETGLSIMDKASEKKWDYENEKKNQEPDKKKQTNERYINTCADYVFD